MIKRKISMSFAVVALAIGVVGCSGPRAVLWHGQNATPSSVAAQAAAYEKPAKPKAVVPIYVATTRARQNNFSLPYGSKRGSSMEFSRVDVGIPAAHKKGMVEDTGYKPDPAKHFAAVSMQFYGGPQEFKRVLNNALRQLPNGNREIFLFIHGYNNNFAESTFRAAQFSYDFSVDAVTVHYSWPSGGALGLYVYDRDSADFARDGLAELLTLISETDAKKISVVSHSMGNYVTMEAMRTLALKGNHRPIDRITSFMMAAPDIDVDVFERQLKDIKRLPKQTGVLVSRKDAALTVSGTLTGGHPRVGDGSSIDILRKNGIAVIDMSDVDGGAHDVFASSPTLMALAKEGGLAKADLEDTGSNGGEAILADGKNVISGTANLILYMPSRLLSSLNQ